MIHDDAAKNINYYYYQKNLTFFIINNIIIAVTHTKHAYRAHTERAQSYAVD